MRTGEFRKDLDPTAAAYAVFGSMEGLLLLSKSLKEIEPLEMGFRAVLQMMKEVRR